MIASKVIVRELLDLVPVTVGLPVLERVEVRLRMDVQAQEEVILVVHFLTVVPVVTCESARRRNIGRCWLFQLRGPKW